MHSVAQGSETHDIQKNALRLCLYHTFVMIISINTTYGYIILMFRIQTINGDGKQSRDFTYIENVIEANLKACLASHEAAGQAFNIAYGGREYLIDIYFEQ